MDETWGCENLFSFACKDLENGKLISHGQRLTSLFSLFLFQYFSFVYQSSSVLGMSMHVPPCLTNTLLLLPNCSYMGMGFGIYILPSNQSQLVYQKKNKNQSQPPLFQSAFVLFAFPEFDGKL